MREKLLNESRKLLSDRGYGSGTNYTTNLVSELMVQFYEDIERKRRIKEFQFSVGEKVHYIRDNCTDPKEYENGIVKENPDHTDKSVRVVYNCDNDWENYQNYTGALTPLSNLRKGWYEQK